MSNYFFLQAQKKYRNADFISQLERYSNEHKENVYILDRPLTDQKYNYEYSDSLIVLVAKHKVAIVNFGIDSAEFEDYIEDVIEDLGSISDKYQYKEIIGRPRKWRDALIETEL